jgi:hypothetical protein
MLDTRIILSGLWGATMLTFLWGDVLGLISGHTEAGKLGESVYEGTHAIWVGIAALMMAPILMIVLTLTLNHPAIRWVNIIVAVFWIIFNLSSLSGYPAYNKFLLIVSMVFNLMIIWYAWKWGI